MGRSRKRGPNATGRNEQRLGSEGAVIIIRRSMWESPQVSALSNTARSLLVELTAMYSGPDCNGKLFLAQEDAARRLGLSDRKAVASAFSELETVGLLRCTCKGDFRVKAGGVSRASTYQLLWKDAEGRAVPRDALKPLDFQTLTTKAKRRIEARSECIDRFRKRKKAGEDSSHLNAVRAEMQLPTGEETLPL